MATVLKETSKVSKRIREVENYLREKGISITFRSDGLLFEVDGDTFVMRESETGNLEMDFPSDYDGTRIQPINNYIYGT